MAKFCTECGKEIAEGIAFCTECGAKAEASEPKPVSVPPPVTQSPTTNTAQQVSYQQPSYSPPVADNQNKVISTGLYIGLMLLFAIPIIGFIACIIMAFAAKNKNIKNYAKATLIWMIIAFVLIGILVAIASVLVGTLTDYINQITDGQFGDFGDFFSQFNDIKDSMNDIGSITDQFQNGDLSSLPLD